MIYWPMSEIIPHPHVQPYVQELQHLHMRLPSPQCLNACAEVMQATIPVEAPNLVVVDTDGGPSRRLFLRRPGRTEWERLERACGHATAVEGRIYMLIDALH